MSALVGVGGVLANGDKYGNSLGIKRNVKMQSGVESQEDTSPLPQP